MSKKKALEEASENIKVAVRVRPLNSKERDAGYKSAVQCEGAAVRLLGVTGTRDLYTFDYAFDHNNHQVDIFQQVIVPMAESVLEGYNATVFAYGQSGSGKTHTMQGVLGDGTLEGVSPRSFKFLFNRVAECIASGTSQRHYRINCSYLELYNNKVRDLLSSNPDANIPIKEAKDKTFFVPDLSVFEVHTVDELNNFMDQGTAKRKVESTNLNAVSSRSHSVFTVHVELTETLDDGGKRVVTSKLNLVDLAGSERQAKTGAEGDRLKEGCNINLSLSALGTVIDALVKANGHIPFRSSPLTMLLKDSLGGGSKTLMFANMGPSEHNMSETISTLRFADRAKQIKNKPTIQMDAKDLRIKMLEDENERLREKLKKYESGSAENMEEKVELLEEKIAKLEAEARGFQEETDRINEEANLFGKKHEDQLEALKKELAAKEEQVRDTAYEKQVAATESAATGALKELRDMVCEYVREMRKLLSVPDAHSEVKCADDVDDAAEARRIQEMLDGLKRFAQQGLSASKLEEEIARVKREAIQETEAKYGQLTSDHTAEIARLTSLNEQSQEGLVQAVSRLQKMKEKIDKEKKSKKEMEEKFEKEREDLAEKHKADTKTLKAALEDLEDRLQKKVVEASTMRKSSFSMHLTRNDESEEDDEVVIPIPQNFVWESKDPRTEEWTAYPDSLQATIEMAYSQGKASIDVTLNAGTFTIKFEENRQYNADGKSRPLRRRIQATGPKSSDDNSSELKALKANFAKQKKAMLDQMEALNHTDTAEAKEKARQLEAELAKIKGDFSAQVESLGSKAAKTDSDEQVKKLKAQFAQQKKELLNQIESLGQEGDGAAEAKKLLEDQLAKLKESAAAEIAEIQQKSGGHPSIKSSKSFRARVDTGQNSVEMQAFMEEAEQTNVTLQAEVARLTSEVERVKRDADLQITEVKANIDSLHEEVARSKAMCEQMRLETDQEKGEMESEAEELRGKVSEEMAKAAEAHKQQMVAAGELEKARLEIASSAQKIEALELKIPELTNYKNQAQTEVENAKVSVERLERKLKDKDALLEQKAQILSTQKELLEKKKHKEREMEEEISNFEKKLMELENQSNKEREELVERVTKAHNQKLNAMVEQHQLAMQASREKHQEQKHKLLKKVDKATNAANKVRTRYDEEIVYSQSLTQQIEEMKVEMLRMHRGGGGANNENYRMEENRDAIKDMISQAKESRANRLLSDRQSRDALAAREEMLEARAARIGNGVADKLRTRVNEVSSSDYSDHPVRSPRGPPSPRTQQRHMSPASRMVSPRGPPTSNPYSRKQSNPGSRETSEDEYDFSSYEQPGNVMSMGLGPQPQKPSRPAPPPRFAATGH